jgi:hypothetical protein
MVFPEGVEVTAPNLTERLLFPNPGILAVPPEVTTTVPLDVAVVPQVLSTVPLPPDDPKIW